jgi:hypothetical protein
MEKSLRRRVGEIPPRDGDNTNMDLAAREEVLKIGRLLMFQDPVKLIALLLVVL